MEKIQEDVSTTYCPNADDISLSSIVSRGLPPKSECLEEKSTAASSENKMRAKSEPAISHAGALLAAKIACRPSTKGILHSENTKGKSPKGRVSFRDEEKEPPSVEKEHLRPSENPRRSSEPLRMFSPIDEQDEREVDEKHAEGESVGVGVYMMVDRLRPSQCFVSITLYLTLVLNPLCSSVQLVY